MSELTKELRKANREGLCPPQNWTSRAINEIEALERKIDLVKIGYGELQKSSSSYDNGCDIIRKVLEE